MRIWRPKRLYKELKAKENKLSDPWAEIRVCSVLRASEDVFTKIWRRHRATRLPRVEPTLDFIMLENPDSLRG